MKKIIIPLLFLAAALWAETKVELLVVIDMGNNLFSYDKMDFIDVDDEECMSLFANPALEPKDVEKLSVFYYDLYCGRGGLWKSALDSNILFARSSGGNCCGQALEFYILTGATHTLGEVIEDEITRYKKCDCFDGNDSLFSFLLTGIDSELMPEVERELKKDIDMRRFIFYDIKLAKRLYVSGGPYVDCGDMVDLFLDIRNGAISKIPSNNSRFESIRVQNHRLTVSPKLEGRDFVLFDVNGHELRRGILKDNMEIPAYPTVIKIQDFGSRLLK